MLQKQGRAFIDTLTTVVDLSYNITHKKFPLWKFGRKKKTGPSSVINRVGYKHYYTLVTDYCILITFSYNTVM